MKFYLKVEDENLGDQVASDEELSNLTKNLLQIDDQTDKKTSEVRVVGGSSGGAGVSDESNQSHWFVYEEKKTPEYIIDAKKRMNQIRQPHLVPSSNVRHVRISDDATKVIEDKKASTIGDNNERRHWLTWPNPSTPEKVREIRGRLGDDRYKRMTELKSMFKRPKSAFYNDDIKNTKTIVSF